MSEEEQKKVLAELAEAIQRILPGMEGVDADVEPGAALIKFALVVDWLNPDSARVLSRCGGNLDGEWAAGWDMAGLLHEALNGEWD